MPNPYEELTAFFKAVGLAQLQLESMRVECYMHRGFNVSGAFASIDRRHRGEIDAEDLRSFMPEKERFTKEEAVYAICALANKNQWVSEEQFAAIFQGDDRQMCQKVLARETSLLGRSEIDLLYRLVRVLAKVGRVLEQTKQDLQIWSTAELFSTLDSDQKGCVNNEWIRTFLMVNGLTDEDILRSVGIYLKRVGALVIFPATLADLIRPTSTIELKRCRSTEPLAESKDQSLYDNVRWKLELEKHQSVRLKILNEVTERTVRKWCSPQTLHLGLDSSETALQGSAGKWREVGDRCDALETKIRELKRKLANDSDRQNQQKTSGKVRPRQHYATTSNWNRKAIESSTGSAWRPKNSSFYEEAVRQQAQFRISDIEQSAKDKLRNNREELAREQLLIRKCEQLNQANSRRALLEQQLNFTTRKAQQLQKDVVQLSNSPRSELDPVPSQLSVNSTAPQFKRKTSAANPLRLNLKARHIDMQFERLRQRLEGERRFRRL